VLDLLADMVIEGLMQSGLVLISFVRVLDLNSNMCHFLMVLELVLNLLESPEGIMSGNMGAKGILSVG